MRDPVRVALAVQGGLSPVCATCAKYWGARERGIEGDRCLSVEGCGGPMSGDDFHEYNGPITDFSRWCFVCGDSASYGAQVDGRDRVIGVCKEHVTKLVELRPVGREHLPPRVVVKSDTGVVTLDKLLSPKKKTLGEAIHEVEAHYAEKEDSE